MALDQEQGCGEALFKTLVRKPLDLGAEVREVGEVLHVFAVPCNALSYRPRGRMAIEVPIIPTRGRKGKPGLDWPSSLTGIRRSAK